MASQNVLDGGAVDALDAGGASDPWQKHAPIAKLPYHGILTHRGRARPINVRIETVNTCNNLCIICAYQDQDRAKTVMPMWLFKKAVADYCELGGGYLSLTPLVGDVLLDKHLIERLEYLETVPEIQSLGVTTNAAMAHRFSDAELHYVVQRFSRISISIYGLDEAEYRTMTKRNTFDKMVEGISRIVACSRAPISLEFRLLKKRTGDELSNWVKREILPESEPARMAEKVIINSNITDYANWSIYDEKNNPLPHDATWFPSQRQEARPQCLIPIFELLVFSNGNVSFCPCDNFNDVEELRLGNIKEQTLAQLYNSARARALWDWKTCGTPDFCKTCTFHIPVSLLEERPSILTDPWQIIGAG